ncbi:hypothetical protein J7L60_04575 [Candidatus Bathyarchaeota archaeon]|nr:hypothetical protein [Candidatus Bathyarchaeota archaeon]
MNSGLSDAEIEALLKGKTLLVYLYLLRRSNEEGVGVREVQRMLGFSSPSVASYHLQKLVDLGLVRKERGQYLLAREVRVGILRHFVMIGRFMLPQVPLLRRPPHRDAHHLPHPVPPDPLKVQRRNPPPGHSPYDHPMVRDDKNMEGEIPIIGILHPH